MSVALAKPFSVRLFEKTTTHWMVQPKLDGVRAIWRDCALRTRTDKPIHAPGWFTNILMHHFGEATVDGELILKEQLLNPSNSANMFQDVVSTVRKKVPGDEWDDISFCAFDIKMHWVDDPVPYDRRLDYIENGLSDGDFSSEYWFTATPCRHIMSIPVLGFLPSSDESSEDLVMVRLDHALDLGFEGIMLRDANSPWIEKRTDRLLKVKAVADAEATVVAIQEGEGKHKGRVGALICEDAEGRRFKVGTGLTDEERSHGAGYWIDQYITYRYTERTRAGMPRHPSFVAIRDYE